MPDDGPMCFVAVNPAGRIVAAAIDNHGPEVSDDVVDWIRRGETVYYVEISQEHPVVISAIWEKR